MIEIDTKLISEVMHPLVIERREIWNAGDRVGPPVEMHSAYAHDGSYVGDWDETKALWEKWGIKPERREPGKKVASVGYSENRGKWFGWSHRAIAEFDTRDRAADFAESVS